MSFNQHHTNCLLLTVIAKRKDTVQGSRKIFKFLLSEAYWVGLRSKQRRLSAATPKVTTNVIENLEQILTRSVNNNFYGEHIQIKLYSN